MSRNDITGDPIRTRVTTDAYRSEWERLYGGKKDGNTKTEIKAGSADVQAKPSGKGDNDGAMHGQVPDDDSA